MRPWGRGRWSDRIIRGSGAWSVRGGRVTEDRVGRGGRLRNGQVSQWRRGIPGFPPARERRVGGRGGDGRESARRRLSSPVLRCAYASPPADGSGIGIAALSRRCEVPAFAGQGVGNDGKGCEVPACAGMTEGSRNDGEGLRDSYVAPRPPCCCWPRRL